MEFTFYEGDYILKLRGKNYLASISPRYVPGRLGNYKGLTRMRVSTGFNSMKKVHLNPKIQGTVLYPDAPIRVYYFNQLIKNSGKAEESRVK